LWDAYLSANHIPRDMPIGSELILLYPIPEKVEPPHSLSAYNCGVIPATPENLRALKAALAKTVR
jgi:hypothetical protein